MSGKPVIDPDQLAQAIGKAAVRLWSDLPRDVQHQLFEEVVNVRGEAIRSQLAELLHEKHRRTAQPLAQKREALEPDSLGG